jgi:putative ABC transport system permease protein
MNILKLAWKNIVAKPLSMLLTLVLFGLGIGLTAFLLLVSNQLEEKFEKNLGGINLVIGAKGSPLQLILCNMYHIDVPTGNISLKEARPFLNPRHPFIEKAYPLSLGDSYKGYRIVGTDTSFIGLYKGVVNQGKIYQNTFEVTIGATVATQAGLKVGSQFKSNHGLVYDDEGGSDSTKSLTHTHEQTFSVVGIFAPTGSVLDQLIVTPTASVWAVHEGHDHEAADEHDHEGHDHADHDHEGHDHHDHEGHDHHDHEGHNHAATEGGAKTLFEESDEKEITSILLKFKSNNITTLNMARNINENTEMQAASPAIEINRLYSMMGVGENALRSLAYLIIFVSGLSIFISLFSSLRERQYELALMRVMGASRGRLFLQIVSEGLLLALFGFVFGVGLAHVAMQILAGYMTDTYRYAFTGWTFLAAEWGLLLGALLIGFVAAMIPALRAYQTNISKTLSNS